MSENDPENDPETGIADEDLPEELQPTDDNPLAKPLTDRDDPKSAEELDMQGGKAPQESDGPDESDEGDSEE